MGDVGAGRKEGREIVIGMYCMREKNLKDGFNVLWFQFSNYLTHSVKLITWIACKSLSFLNSVVSLSFCLTPLLH